MYSFHAQPTLNPRILAMPGFPPTMQRSGGAEGARIHVFARAPHALPVQPYSLVILQRTAVPQKPLKLLPSTSPEPSTARGSFLVVSALFSLGSTGGLRKRQQ